MFVVICRWVIYFWRLLFGRSGTVSVTYFCFLFYALDWMVWYVACFFVCWVCSLLVGESVLASTLVVVVVCRSDDLGTIILIWCSRLERCDTWKCLLLLCSLLVGAYVAGGRVNEDRGIADGFHKGFVSGVSFFFTFYFICYWLGWLSVDFPCPPPPLSLSVSVDQIPES